VITRCYVVCYTYVVAWSRFGVVRARLRWAAGAAHCGVGRRVHCYTLLLRYTHVVPPPRSCSLTPSQHITTIPHSLCVSVPRNLRLIRSFLQTHNSLRAQTRHGWRGNIRLTRADGSQRTYDTPTSQPDWRACSVIAWASSYEFSPACYLLSR